MEYISKKDWDWVSNQLKDGYDFTLSNDVISLCCDKFTKSYPRDNKYIKLDIGYLNLSDLYIEANCKEDIEYICNELHKSNTEKTYLKLIKENKVAKSSFFSLYEQSKFGLI